MLPTTSATIIPALLRAAMRPVEAARGVLLRTRRALIADFGIPEVLGAGFLRLSAYGDQYSVQPGKGLSRAVVGPEPQTLTQSRARRQKADAYGLFVKHIAAKVLNGVEVALALHQQAEVTAHHIAVGNPPMIGRAASSPDKCGRSAFKYCPIKVKPATGVRS